MCARTGPVRDERIKPQIVELIRTFNRQHCSPGFTSNHRPHSSLHRHTDSPRHVIVTTRSVTFIVMLVVTTHRLRCTKPLDKIEVALLVGLYETLPR